jgi:hypothetical protein
MIEVVKGSEKKERDDRKERRVEETHQERIRRDEPRQLIPDT